MILRHNISELSSIGLSGFCRWPTEPTLERVPLFSRLVLVGNLGNQKGSRVPLG